MSYIIYFSPIPDQPRVLKVEPLPPFNEYAGRRAPQPFPQVRVVLTNLSPLPDVGHYSSYFVLRRTVLDVLEEVGETHYEILPLLLVDRKGHADAHSFCIVNLLDNIACMDMEHSTCQLDEDGFVSHVKRLVLDENKIPADRHLFRVDELSNVIVVSSKLRRALETQEMASGVRFVPIEEFEI